MTRKHYRAIAEILRSQDLGYGKLDKVGVIQKLGAYFKEENERFALARFVEASGIRLDLLR